MAGFERLSWPGDPRGLRRRDRLPGVYDAYVPDFLSSRDFSLNSEISCKSASVQAELALLAESSSFRDDPDYLSNGGLRPSVSNNSGEAQPGL